MAAKKKSAKPARPPRPTSSPEQHILQPKGVIKSISWDWKDSPDFDDLNKALWPFGVYVYPDPACEGQDSMGFIFSDKPLSTAEIRAVNCDDD
jgi:hypothetical protein